MLFEKPLNEISENDIPDLIETKTIETKTLEFKGALPNISDVEKKLDFLGNIVSFANSSGGLIIYGMGEKGGIASKIVNIDTSEADAKFRRMFQIIEAGIEPRMITPALQPITIGADRIYIMKILSSFNKPHRVKDNRKFYMRRDNGKYELDIGEIKDLVLLSSTLEDRFEKFKIQRLMKIKSGNFPFEYASEKIVALHIASLSSLGNSVQLSLPKIASTTDPAPFWPLAVGGMNRIYNFDGLMHYSKNGDKVSSYVQIFRNGMLEISNFELTYSYGHEGIRGIDVQEEIQKAINDYITNLQEFGISYPYFISISMLNTKGRKISSDHSGREWVRAFWGDFGGISEDDLIFPTLYVENKDELSEKLKFCFDIFWNADGYESSPIVNTQ
jgi:hypothetical protein